MTYLKIFLAVAFVIAAQITIASAQSTAKPSEIKESADLGNPFADLCVSGNCMDGMGKKAYDNGDVYEGDFVNGKRRGKGKLIYKNGDVYVGDFVSDRKEGQGTLTFKDGGVYVGEFSIDLFYLKGRMKYANGDIYEGDWAIGMREGQGTYTAKNGQIYVGQFANDKFNGKGKLKFPDGETYDGDWVENLRNGKGRTVYPMGDVYDGDWVNGKREGQATYTFKNGNYHIGSWKNGLQNGDGKYFDKLTNKTMTGTWKDGVFLDTAAANSGQTTFKGGADYDKAPAAASIVQKGCVSGNCVNGYGKLRTATGDIYEGNFVNSLASGKGKDFYANGTVYDGDFLNGKKHGQGTFTFKSGQIYVGQFANDIRNGKGKFTYPDGVVYEGDFVDDLREGQGVYKFQNGSVYTGQYSKGVRNGKGKIVTLNGETYDGNWVDDKRSGKGRSTYVNGDSYDGDWVNGLREGQATYTYKNGSYYIGGFRNDKQHGTGKQFNKLTGSTIEGVWKDGAFVNTTVTNTITTAASAPKPPVDQTAARLIEILNGKYDYLEGRPLQYILTNKKTNETLRYQIEFIYDGGKLAFKWKELNKKDQSEKLVITDDAMRSASKYVNFFATKTTIAPDKEIAFILSQTLYKGFKANKELSLDLGDGPKRLRINVSFTASTGTFTDRIDLKEHRLQADDGVTKVQLLDDPICPLITKIETAEYTLTLVRG